MFEFNVVPVEPCDPACRKRKIKPILFNTDMVEAILDGRKTQTRRVVKGIEGLNVYRAEPAEDAYETLHQWDFLHGFSENGAFYDMFETVNAPCAIGDILWVRETWRPIEASSAGWCRIEYKAGGAESFQKIIAVPKYQEPWHPSIHMPKEAARIFLKVKGVRAERLQEITEEQAVKEGCSAGRFEITCGPWGVEDDPDEWTAKAHFMNVWNSTIKEADRKLYDSIANPWVWVIEFERCEKPEGWCVTD